MYNKLNLYLCKTLVEGFSGVDEITQQFELLLFHNDGIEAKTFWITIRSSWFVQKFFERD